MICCYLPSFHTYTYSENFTCHSCDTGIMRSSIVSVFSALSLVQFSLAGRYRVWTYLCQMSIKYLFILQTCLGARCLQVQRLCGTAQSTTYCHISPWENIQRPLPTNVWWQNMVQEAEDGEMISVPDPYIVKEWLTEKN